MIESPKNTRLNLINLGRLLKDKMEEAKKQNEQIKNLKEEIRGIMIENDLKNFGSKEDGITIKCTRSFSFDVGMFKYKEPELAKTFITEETITTVKDVFDKKELQKCDMETYKKYLVENTPRLSVK